MHKGTAKDDVNFAFQRKEKNNFQTIFFLSSRILKKEKDVILHLYNCELFTERVILKILNIIDISSAKKSAI